MTIFHVREGPITAGDTRTALLTQGNQASPGVIKVPSWANEIKTIVTAVGDNTPTGADGGHNFLLTLSGDGMKDGEQTFPIGAAFTDFTTAGDTGLRSRCFTRHDMDLDVKPEGTIGIYAEATLGVLWGQPEVSVELQFFP